MITYEIGKEIKNCEPKELFSQLPICIKVNKFTEESAAEFSRDFILAKNSWQPIIPIVIDSFGGQVYALLSMIDDVIGTNKPVMTIVKGKAMSCGAILLSCGWHGLRYAAKNSTVMIHEVSSFTVGKIEEIKADVTHTTFLNDKIFDILDKNCQQPKDYFKNIVHDKGHADWFLTGDDCVNHKLVNHTTLPEFKVNVRTELTW